MINTVEKFVNTSGFDKGDNYPTINSLIFKLIELKAVDNILIDVISYFLYDGEAIQEVYQQYLDKEFKFTIKYEAEKTSDNWEKLLDLRNKGLLIENFKEHLETL